MKLSNYDENLILVDNIVKQDWEFSSELSDTTGLKWRVASYYSTGSMKGKINNVKRYYKYFFFSFTVFLKRKHIKNIIAWQQFYGLIFAFYCELFHVKKTSRLIIMTFIYKEKQGFVGKIYFKFINIIVNSKYIDKLICFSKNEVEYYSKVFNLKNKIEYVPLGIEDYRKYIDKVESENLANNEEKQPYFLSVGRSNRDYEFLINSLQDEKYKIKILSDQLENKNIGNVSIKNNVFSKQYFEELKNCFAVIIPLKNSNISSGQLAILQAMQFKKPIIITKSKSISEYVTNEKNALIIKKDKQELLKAMNRLICDRDLYNNLAKNGYEILDGKFSLKALAVNIGILFNNHKDNSCNIIN